jgi:hypothetical protein
VSTTADRIIYLEALIAALQTAVLTVVQGTFSEVQAVEQRFRTLDPMKLEDMRTKAETELRGLRSSGGRGGLVLRQGR